MQEVSLESVPHPATVANRGFSGLHTKNVIIVVVTVTGRATPKVCLSRPSTFSTTTRGQQLTVKTRGRWFRAKSFPTHSWRRCALATKWFLEMCSFGRVDTERFLGLFRTKSLVNGSYGFGCNAWNSRGWPCYLYIDVYFQCIEYSSLYIYLVQFRETDFLALVDNVWRH